MLQIGSVSVKKTYSMTTYIMPGMANTLLG